MSALISRLFLDHPRSVDESYFEHQAFAIGFAARLIGAGLAALVHAVLPFAFETTASRMVRAMAAELEARRRARG
jgi:hypothetical protein